jgi:hypothetical protein
VQGGLQAAGVGEVSEEFRAAERGGGEDDVATGGDVGDEPTDDGVDAFVAGSSGG